MTIERPDWDDREGETEFSLVLPFIEVTSKGGKYDDDSFVAGYQMGVLDGSLRSREIAAGTYLIYSTLIAQADLIAMRHNYKFDVLHDDETWAQIGVTRIEE